MNGKHVHIIFAVLFLFLTIQAQEKQVEVTNFYAKVYLAPSPKSKFIGLAQKGEAYKVVNVTDYWYRIQFKSALGWVIRSEFKDYNPHAQNSTSAANTVKVDSTTSGTPTDTTDIFSEVTNTTPGTTSTTIDTAKDRIAPQTNTPLNQKTLYSRSGSQVQTQQEEQKPAKSRIRNWFTQQNFLSGPPTEQSLGEPEQRYFQVTFAPARILLYLSPDSPLLGMAKKGELLPLVGEGDSWCKVAYRDTIGWIESKNGNVVTAPASLLALDFKKVGIVLGASIVLILFIILILRIFRKNNGEIIEEKQSIAAKKNVLIIAKKSKQIEHSLTDTHTTLEKCFSELGFHFSIAKDLPSVRNILTKMPPDLVLVDMEFDRSILSSVDRIFSQLPGCEKMLFVIYNAPDPSLMRPSRVLPKMIFLGLYFSDQDIFKIITPLILSENAKNVQKSIQSSALEGNIADGNLMEVLEFIEIGRKTGCILMEQERPLALIYFNNGRIIYAATAQGILGRDAVFAVLKMKEGKFRFIIDRKPKTSNVNLSTLEVLMEWTKAVDEANGH